MLKRIFAVLAFISALSAVPSAIAAQTAPTGQDLVAEIGHSYQHYASMLGCPVFAGGTISKDGSVFTLKYLPEGATLANWTRMSVISVYGLSGSNMKDTQTISDTISTLEGQYKKYTMLTEDENYLSPQQEKTMFIQYWFGRGPQAIYAAGAYLRTSTVPPSASFIQLQSRGTPLPPEAALKVQLLVNPTAKLPGQETPEKKP